MLLELGHILVERKQTGDEYLNLRIGQMAERRLEQQRHILLDVQRVVRYRTESHRYVIVLDEAEHVGEDLGVHCDAGGVRGVRDDGEDVHQNVGEVLLVEGLSIRMVGHSDEKLRRGNGCLRLKNHSLARNF